MKLKIRESLLLFSIMTSIITAGTLSARSQENPLGEFTGQTDIGSPKLSGACSFDAERQAYTLAGAGSNMWFTNDQCHFIWKKMKGDFILRTRVEFIGQGVVEHRKAGWMVRPSLEADAPYVDCAEHGSGLTSIQFRRFKGANTEEVKLAITNPDVLQFERKGNIYIFSAAHYGEAFVSAELPILNLGDDVYAGLFVCSHDADVIEKAVFRDVRIIRPVKEGFVPYKDYIGSVLEILEVHSGKLEKIYESAQPFEAPNWMRDGATLIYNVSGRAEGWGRLNRFDLATKTPTPLDTGSNNRNNNDHVLSFDGTMLGISDQSPDHGGQSCIFTLPSRGGTPKRITPLTPSYLHGWSPDGKWMVIISFPEDINPVDHPYYQQCYLRLLPIDGGNPKVIAYVYGGQGTINVPSWSPDSQRIAFVSNSGLTE